MAFTLIVSPFCYMQEIVSQQHENKDTSTTTVIDNVGAEGPNNCKMVDPMMETLPPQFRKKRKVIL